MSDQFAKWALLSLIPCLLAITPPDARAAEGEKVGPSFENLPAPVAKGSLNSPEEKGDVDWYADEKTGIRYRIEKVPNREASYRMLDEERAQFPYGAILHVIERDEEWVYVKFWEQKSWPKAPRPATTPEPPSEEQLKQTAESYRPETEKVDRLSFERFDEGLPTRGQWRNGFNVADMNGDGHLDIVFGPSRKGRAHPNIFLGDGKGTWQRWQVRYPNLPYDYGDVAVADFNGDGVMDLALAFHLRGMAVLVGDGEDGFLPWTDGIALDHPGAGGDATSFSSRRVSAIDWNQDGRPDLLALGEGPKGVKMGPKKMSGQMINTSRGLLLYLNNGDGTWEPLRPQEVVDQRRFDFGDDFVIADFNGDELPDVVSATSRMGYQDILNVSNENRSLRRERLRELRPGAQITAVAAADLNGDGFDDLAVSYVNRENRVWRSGIDLLYADGEFGWTRKVLISREARFISESLAFGHLDGDQSWDLVSLSGQGQVTVFLGDGNGFLVEEHSPEMPPREDGCRGFDVELADIDRDGRDEIVAAFAGEQTGYPGIPGYNNPGCASQGSIRVWRPAPTTAAE